MTRALRMGAFALVVVALLAFAPGAFASTLTKSGADVTWTAASGFQNNVNLSDADADTITISLGEDPVPYDQSGPSTTITPGCDDTDGTTDGTAYQITCTGTTGGRLTVNAGDGQDNVDASQNAVQSHNLTLNGEGDDDALYGGSADDLVDGGPGRDYVTGSQGDDIVHGGDGNDQSVDGGPGNDQVYGDAGNDGTMNNCCGSRPDAVKGGPGNDLVDGGDGNDAVYGDRGNGQNPDDGNDTVLGGAGDDELHGQGGDDVVDGGDGDDSDLAGGPGNDVVNGGAGNDGWNGNFNGGTGADQLNGGPGDDSMYENADGSADTVAGGDGVDYFAYYGDNGCCGNNTDDQLTATLDGVANDGYQNLSGSSYADDPNNNFGADIESLYTDSDSAPSIVNGTAAANIIQTGDQGADTVDPGAGADVVQTMSGPDTVNAQDGYPDNIDCGDGTDTANVDQFDTVVRCETVNRTTAASAYDVPEDAAPAISWVTPSNNKTIPTATPTHLEVAASDDRGVAKVDFYVGQRLVCTDTTAPYACDYSPLGADLGRNTLVAIVTDTAGQTATAFNSVIVPRFVPASVSAKTTPRKDTKAPFRFKTSGKVNLPKNVTAAQGCTGGHVSVQVRVGKNTVSNRRVATKANCTYSSTVTFRIPSRLKAKKLTVLVRFLGSSVLGPRSHKSYTITVV